jgi:hypothetical protein
MTTLTRVSYRRLWTYVNCPLLGAAWMLGSFKYLAENNVNAITFFETCGWRGLFPHIEETWPETWLDNDDEFILSTSS